MQTINDDAAFPSSVTSTPQSDIVWSSHHPDTKGLTKREYFVSVAMQGLIQRGQYKDTEDLAKKAIAAADAMIRELNNQE